MSSKPAARNASALSFMLLALLIIGEASAARAADLFDKTIDFHIAGSPLAGALIEFSTQSGIQVAAADADIAHLNTNGVMGVMPVSTALNKLLEGTGMKFARVGDETAAIRLASIAPAADPATPSDTPATTITIPAPPSSAELTGNSLYDFVSHHATTHYGNIATTGNLARWRGGLQSICPITEGLSPGYNAFVTARVRALAAYVGAPVQSDPQCKSNVQIFFTSKPKEKMDSVVAWATGPAFKSRYSGGGRDLLAFTPDHAVQGWYLTTNGGSAVLNTDVSLVGLNVLPLWPRITQNYGSVSSTGTHLGGGSGSGVGIGVVILVVDQTKVVGSTIGEIADYLAMLALSVAQSPDHCDPLPSIFDLMSSNCGTRAKPTGVTAADLAFLKALYYRNTGIGASPSRSDLSASMMRQFDLH